MSWLKHFATVYSENCHYDEIIKFYCICIALRSQICGFLDIPYTRLVFAVAVLHKTGKPGLVERAAEGEALEDILAIRDSGNRPRQGSGRSRAGLDENFAGFSIQQPRQPSGTQRSHVVSFGVLFVRKFTENHTFFGLISFILPRGTFRMEREDGYTFDCRIPPFSLESKPDGGSATPPETV